MIARCRRVSVFIRGAAMALASVFVLLSSAAAGAQPLQAIDLGIDLERIDISRLGRTVDARGDAVQIETAVATDGTTGRMAVRAATPGTSPNWFVFALRNPTERPVERWIVSERYAQAGSGVVWPTLDARRLEAVTPSLGVVPERLPFDSADAFRLAVEPGQTVTFVVELAGERLPRMQLWRAVDFEKRSRNTNLFHGILLGITGLLAIFLTVIFAANHKAIFPAAALFVWCVLLYLLVDFGLWHKLFHVRPEENAQYRAAAEAGMTASLLIFIHTFLRLGRLHAIVRLLIGLAMIGTLSLVGLAFLDPRLAATFARLGLPVVLATSGMIMAYLAVRGQDRALAIVPSWILFGVWSFAAALVLTGQLQGDVIVASITAGLVLLVMLIGFTVTQFAFRTIEPTAGISPDDQKLRALAVDSTGAAVFEWNAKRQDVRIGPVVLASLGHKPAEIREPLQRFIERLHDSDKDRLQQVLAGLSDHGKGLVQLHFRMKHVDGSYRWFELEGAGVATGERRMARCVGLVRETTDAKRTQDRLLQDAVHDSLTLLPNRSLFIDRLEVAIQRAKGEPLVRPTLFHIDLDRFSTLNATHGTPVGDALLITVARRLARLVGTADTLARIGGDHFAIILAQARTAEEQYAFAAEIRAAVKGVITISTQEIILSCSIGIAQYHPRVTLNADDLLSDAEVAMYRARRGGADRIERFGEEMRTDRNDRHAIERELVNAIDRKALAISFQPIMQLRNEELAGFEAQVRWEHPRFGLLDPAAFVPLDERSDLMVRLGTYVLQAALAEAQRWNTEWPRPGAPIFVSVNIATRQLFRPEFVVAVRHLLAQAKIPRDALRLEITEMVVMDNPEQASIVLRDLAEAGVKLSLDDFGAGYSSLSYLTSFPFDTVKVDRSLVHMATQSAGGTAVLRAIVALSHELGKTVVAEGTDNEDDAGLLRSLGCDHAQGSYYGETKSARQALGYIKDMRRQDRRRRGGGLFRLRERQIEDAKASTPATPAVQRDSGEARAAGKRRTTVKRPTPVAATVAPLPNTVVPVGATVASAANVPSAMPRVPPMPPPSIAPLPIDRGLARLKAEIERASQPMPAPRTLSDLPRLATSGGAIGSEVLPPPLPPMTRGEETPAMPAAAAIVPAEAPQPREERADEPVPPPRPVVTAPPPVELDFSTLPPAIAASLAKLAGAHATKKTGTDGGGG